MSDQAIDTAKVRNALRAARGQKEVVQGSQQSLFTVSEEFAAFLLLAAHLIAALYAPIQDCDEVYNFWEPTHYLNHRYGMQTWEFSPEYAIRSWAYAGLHSTVIYFASWLPVVRSKSAEFYALRIVFAFVASQFETRLFRTISTCMSPRIATFFLLAMATSAGMFHASIAYLPSSFAMYCVTYALGQFMNWRGGLRTPSGLMWLAIGSIVGWPFIAALAIPFIAEELIMSSISDDIANMLRRFFNALIRSLIILALTTAVDTFFYHSFTIVPWNIVSYNILSNIFSSSKGAKGPDIYGTEPWHFYIRNLLINFNFWFPLACAAWPLLVLHQYVRQRASSRMTFFRMVVFTAPFYLWLGIFTLQPHKEERFMYPIYPCLALNAAIALHIIILNVGSPLTATSTTSSIATNTVPHTTDQNPKQSAERSTTTTTSTTSPTSSPKPTLLARLKLLTLLAFLAFTTTLNILRSAQLATAYTAPLRVYSPLTTLTPKNSSTDQILCLSKEWHRYPSSFFLPSSTRLGFLPSAFHGLLPGRFSEIDPGEGFGWYPGTWLVPGGMNDGNVEDIGKYVTSLGDGGKGEGACDWLVDSWVPSSTPSVEEPLRIPGVAGQVRRQGQGGEHDESKKWERVHCEPFLDAAGTGVLGRLFWVPEVLAVGPLRRVWGEYCLLRRKP